MRLRTKILLSIASCIVLCLAAIVFLPVFWFNQDEKNKNRSKTEKARQARWSEPKSQSADAADTVDTDAEILESKLHVNGQEKENANSN